MSGQFLWSEESLYLRCDFMLRCGTRGSELGSCRTKFVQVDLAQVHLPAIANQEGGPHHQAFRTLGIRYFTYILFFIVVLFVCFCFCSMGLNSGPQAY
jgi:hypothetical protein